MKWFKQNKTDKEREDSWIEFVDMRIEVYRELAGKDVDKQKLFARLCDLEVVGGNCKTCGVSWVEKKIDNRYVLGKYFVPNCDCFVTCANCNSPLYDLQFKYKNKLKFCDNCGMQLHNTKLKQKRFGKDFKRYLDSLPKLERLRAVAERFDD